ncbi:MAG: transposase [Tenuifilaceae bacterium]
MLGKTEKNPQLNLLKVQLLHFINPEHELYKYAKKINWESVEKEFAEYYSPKGAPSIPIRVIVGLTILKQIYKHSEKTTIQHWLENPYWQHFCGEIYFQHKPPFHFHDFSAFRKRIGDEGYSKLKNLASEIFGKEGERAFRSKREKYKKVIPTGVLRRVFNRIRLL